MDNATINVYSGPQPVNANTSLAGENTLLVVLPLGDPAFGDASGGIIVANGISPGTAIANGTATFARILQAGGIVVVMDIAVSTSGAGLNLGTVAITTGALVSVGSCVYSVTET